MNEQPLRFLVAKKAEGARGKFRGLSVHFTSLRIVRYNYFIFQIE